MRFHAAVMLMSTSLMFTLVPNARADVWNKKTIVDFPQAVEVPGTVLQPGKYVVKLADSQSNRHIVQIFNAREDHVFATILAIPKYRMETPEKTIFTFYELPAGQPEALRSWFYPGDNTGNEFVYPKKRAIEIAALVKQRSSGSTTNTYASTTTTTTEQPMVAEETASPDAEQVKTETTVSAGVSDESPYAEEAAAEPAPTPAPAEPEQEPQTPAPSPSTDQSSTPARTMPATAGNFMMLVFAGGMSLAGALRLRNVRKNLS